MKFSASEFYSYHMPSMCELRIYLRHHMGHIESPLGPYEELLKRLGENHEREHLNSLIEGFQVIDLSESEIGERVGKTKEAIEQGVQVVYHGLLEANTTINGTEVKIVGEPDFIIKDGVGYIVRDVKLAQRINDKDHPEIFRQLELYGWLFEQTFGVQPKRLEVFSGASELIPITYDGGIKALEQIGQFIYLRTIDPEPYCPVGWSKCTGCGFYEYCWSRAEENRDVALIYQVDRGLATALHEINVCTIEELVDSFDELRLMDFVRPRGGKTQRVGKRASQILQMAQAMSRNEEIVVEKQQVPNCSDYIMFDVENIPPQMDESEKVYLWGLQVFGENQSEYLSSPAPVGEDNDRICWLDFLENAKELFNSYGDIPFVHWHSHEKTCINRYIERYGDPEGIAQRVLDNLLDLLPVVRNSIALPVPSYSLKVVEKYVNFCRSQTEYGGEWSIAKYIEAVETADEEERESLLGEIVKYNQEDLEATWAVLEWYRNKVAEA